MRVQKEKFQNTTASALLDLVRGLAAFVVCLTHWRNLFFVDYYKIPRHRLLYAIPYALTGGGHQAVVIFFVLSGFLIGGSVFRSFGQGTWSWTQYLTHRLVRLWLVLIPALVLGMILDESGIHLGHAAALYAGQMPNHILSNVAQSLSLGIFAGNVIFLQGIDVRTLGSNGPLWSLANEFWYYILFPCGVLLFRSTTSRSTRLLSGVLLAGIALMVGKGILLAFPIWLLGTLLALIPVPRMGFRWRLLIGVTSLQFFSYLQRPAWSMGSCRITCWVVRHSS